MVLIVRTQIFSPNSFGQTICPALQPALALIKQSNDGDNMNYSLETVLLTSHSTHYIQLPVGHTNYYIVKCLRRRAMDRLLHLAMT